MGDSTAALRATLPGRVLGFARTQPDRVALREKRLGVWEELTWRQYRDEVAACARALWEKGVRPGDHVSILSENRTEWLFADLGAQAIGARSVGIYQTNPPADVGYILAHSASKILIAEDQEAVDKALEVTAETPTVTHIIVVDPRGIRHYDDPRLVKWEDFMAEGRAALAAEPDWFAERVAAIDPNEPCMVVYTSGTTGQPKGAMITHDNAAKSGDGMLASVDAGPDDLILSYLPLCHVAEKIFTLFIPLTVGCVVHFGESLATVQSDLSEVSPTIFLGVPRIWEKMHASVDIKMKDSSWLKRTLFRFFVKRGHPIAARRRRGELTGWDRILWALGDFFVYRPLQERLGLRRCRYPVSGAAPIAEPLLEWFWAIGVPIHEGYGMTECSGASHSNPVSRPRLGTVGQALSSVEHRLADDGEILLKGPIVFAGYLHNPEATADTIKDGWLHTGDVGSVDEAGFLRITGRKKEIIITAGGKNLSPERIENAMKMSPYIKEAVAIGDGRKFISALVQVEYDAASDWATRRKVAFTSYADLVSKAPIRELIQAEIHKSNELLAQVEQVREFRLLPKELHQDDGEVTATQKVRRGAVQSAFAGLIGEMYGRA